MEALYQLLHGSYGYLLILQILVVTGLFVAFLWMMAQRTKTAYSTLSPAFAGQTPNLESAGISASEVQQLKEKCAKLETDNAKAVALKTEYEELVQKVKYLESKLLEYEILQEEIGTLSSLKVENEKLRGELHNLQRELSGSKTKSSNARPSMPEIPPAPPPVAPLAAAAAVAAVDDSAVPNLDFSTVNPTPPEVSIEPPDMVIDPAAFPPGMDLGLEAPPTPQAPESPVAAASAPPPKDDGLEGLLKQIDSLTQSAEK